MEDTMSLQDAIAKNRAYRQACDILNRSCNLVLKSWGDSNDANDVDKALAGRRILLHAIAHLSTDGRIG